MLKKEPSSLINEKEAAVIVVDFITADIKRFAFFRLFLRFEEKDGEDQT